MGFYAMQVFPFVLCLFIFSSGAAIAEDYVPVGEKIENFSSIYIDVENAHIYLGLGNDFRVGIIDPNHDITRKNDSEWLSVVQDEDYLGGKRKKAVKLPVISITVTKEKLNSIRIDSNGGTLAINDIVCRYLDINIESVTATISATADSLVLDCEESEATFNGQVFEDIEVDIDEGTAFMSLKGDPKTYNIFYKQENGTASLNGTPLTVGKHFSNASQPRILDIDIEDGSLQITMD